MTEPTTEADHWNEGYRAGYTRGWDEARASAPVGDLTAAFYVRGRADALREAAERVLTTLPQYVDDEGPAPTHWVPLSGVLAILDPETT